MTLNLKCETRNVDENITIGMRVMFRNILRIKPLEDKKIKELAKEIYENRVVIVTTENMLSLPMASFLVSSFIEDNYIQPDVQFLAKMTNGLCGSMKLILTEDWNKAIKLYNKSLEVFA